jgi:hypothetical protein
MWRTHLSRQAPKQFVSGNSYRSIAISMLCDEVDEHQYDPFLNALSHSFCAVTTLVNVRFRCARKNK